MKAYLASLGLSLLSLCAVAQDATQVPQYLKTGDWQSIGQLMDDDVDLTVLDEEDLYTKDEATTLLKGFMQKHPCSAFKIVHEGTSKMDSQYRIGEYSSSSGVFRITYFLFDAGGISKIKQLRIESL